MEHQDSSAVDEALGRARSQVEERRPQWLMMASAEDFRRMELEAAAIGRDLADAITAEVLREVARDRGLEAVCVAAALRGLGPMRRDGSRAVEVRLLGGSSVVLEDVQYLKPDDSGRPGRRRKPGKRGKSGVGCYPVLAALGIEWGVTPALAAEVTRQVAASESFRPALEALKGRGIDLGYKPTLRIANGYGQRAVKLRNRWAEAIHAGLARRSQLLLDKRVVVALDGGRVRMRVPNQRGRRRKNGHRGFDTPWQEPKLFVIYIVDEQGNVDPTLRPIYDGTLGDCDRAFYLLAAYLKALGADQARELTFLGDGAEWIWNRIEALVKDLDIPPDRVVEVVDWYHATEYLAETAALADHWKDGEKRRWLTGSERLLWQGRIDELAAALGHLGRESGVHDIGKRIAYFTGNRQRMAYHTLRRKHVPVGSGAVESAVRRVINLRLKGNSKFWRRENAEGMLILRGYLKAGRFDDLVAWSSIACNPWWESIAYQDPLGLDMLHDPPIAELAA